MTQLRRLTFDQQNVTVAERRQRLKLGPAGEIRAGLFSFRLLPITANLLPKVWKGPRRVKGFRGAWGAACPMSVFTPIATE